MIAEVLLALWVVAFAESEHIANVALPSNQPEHLMEFMFVLEDVAPRYGYENSYEFMPIRYAGCKQQRPKFDLPSGLDRSCRRGLFGQFDGKLVPVTIKNGCIDRHIEGGRIPGVLQFWADNDFPQVAKFEILQTINAQISSCLDPADFPSDIGGVHRCPEGEVKETRASSGENHHQPLGDGVLPSNKPSDVRPPVGFVAVFVISLIVLAWMAAYALHVVVNRIAPYKDK